MGHYWDYCEQCWKPIDHQRKLTRGQRRRIDRRSQLIEDLIREVECGKNSFTALYAQLLIRQLLKTDELLMREQGERASKLMPEEKKIKSNHPPRA